MRLCTLVRARCLSWDLALPFPALLAAVVVAALVSPGAAQRQFDELGKRGLPLARSDTLATALGDVDGDGDLDLVSGNLAEQSRLYLNDGTGTFTDVTSTHLPAASHPTTSLALGDVDGDGDLDLVLGSRFSPSRLYSNDGRGRFTDTTATHLPSGRFDTTSLALGDVDGDGDLDLVVGNAGTFGEQSRLYLNDGTGRFTDATATRLPAGRLRTTSLALGDVDGDGDLDLVLGNQPQQSRLYLNDGKGRFTDATATRLPAGGYGTFALALGDVDGDGDPDLVLGNRSQRSRLYLNDGKGRFTDATATRLPVGSHATRSLALGDIDGDGDVDLVLGNHLERNRLYLNDGTGSFTDVTAMRLPAENHRTNSVVLGDVDGDDDLDLVLGNGGIPGQQNRLYLNGGTGTFADATATRLPGGSYRTTSLAFGDVDGDGDVDLVLGNSGHLGGQSLLYLNDGTGTFADVTATRLPAGSYSTNSVALGDVDGDGDADLVLGNGRVTGQQSLLYLNDGTGTFTDATATRLPDGSHDTVALALGDVDGDGDLDLVLGNRLQRSLLYLNDGTGRFTDATTRLPGGIRFTTSLALGDVDGDGDLDLVHGIGTQQSRLYLNDGTGTFTDVTATRLPTGGRGTSSLALGDVDRDGDLDLLLGNDVERSRLYLNDGKGTFTDLTTTHLPAGVSRTAALALGDVDGDGDLDLLLGNVAEQSLLYLNDGSGRFTDATNRLPGGVQFTHALALGDVDGDDDLDLVVGNNSQQSRLYLNLQRQLDAPLVLHVGRTYRLDAYARNGPPSLADVAVPYLATATARIPLPPFGTFGLDPRTMVALPPIRILQPAGMGSLSIRVPADRSLAGLAVHAQAFVVQNPVRAHLTNVYSDVVHR